MGKNQLKLARYLKRFLSEQNKPWLDRWLAVHTKPQRIFETKRFAADHPVRSTILSYGMRKLAYRDTQNAKRHWQTLSSSYGFNQAQIAHIERTIALAMNSDDHPDTLDAFNDIEHPNRVAPKAVELTFKRAVANLLPHSLTLVEVALKK